ncbi:MAG: hypothetical protein FWG85_01930 [Bacteroidetes bacterium]|nr:hypothetical protein [Bacteroidota bacterium]
MIFNLDIFLQIKGYYMNYFNKFVIAAIIFCCSFNVLLSQTEAGSKSVRIEFDNYLENIEIDKLDEKSIAIFKMFNQMIRNIAEISDIEMNKIDITGELKYSVIAIKEHYVKDGVDSVNIRQYVMSFEEVFDSVNNKSTFECVDKIDSIFTFEVITKKVDSVKQIFSVRFPSLSYQIRYNRSLLDVPYYLKPIVILDTPNDADVWGCLYGGYNTSSKSIPFIVFSPGQEMGEKCWDICRVQGTGTHPALWYEKFNIKDYLYLEIEFLTADEVKE